MPRFGTVKRQNPRVEVLRGFNPNEPFTLTQAYPVADGVTIQSGQVISLAHDPDGDGLDKWILGWVSGIPYIAYNDWNVTTGKDEDVLEAGKLPGLSSTGQFEIQTAFFSGDEADFVPGAPVGPDAATGDIKVTTVGSAVPIMGYVTRNRGALNLGPTGAGNNGVNSAAVNLDVVSFETAYSPNPV